MTLILCDMSSLGSRSLEMTSFESHALSPTRRRMQGRNLSRLSFLFPASEQRLPVSLSGETSARGGEFPRMDEGNDRIVGRFQPVPLFLPPGTAGKTMPVVNTSTYFYSNFPFIFQPKVTHCPFISRRHSPSPQWSAAPWPSPPMCVRRAARSRAYSRNQGGFLRGNGCSTR